MRVCGTLKKEMLCMKRCTVCFDWSVKGNCKWTSSNVESAACTSRVAQACNHHPAEVHLRTDPWTLIVSETREDQMRWVTQASREGGREGLAHGCYCSVSAKSSEVSQHCRFEVREAEWELTVRLVQHGHGVTCMTRHRWHGSACERLTP